LKLLTTIEYTSTTAIEERKCAPAIIEELMMPLSKGLLLRIPYNNATGQPWDGFTPCDRPKPMIPIRVTTIDMVSVVLYSGTLL
jgi:hypothetical protein